jgi:hypothetical protein
MGSEIDEFAGRRMKCAVSSFACSLISNADEQAKYYKSGNPDKSVDQIRILLSEPQSLDASTLRAAM